MTRSGGRTQSCVASVHKSRGPGAPTLLHARPARTQQIFREPNDRGGVLSYDSSRRMLVAAAARVSLRHRPSHTRERHSVKVTGRRADISFCRIAQRTLSVDGMDSQAVAAPPFGGKIYDRASSR